MPAYGIALITIHDRVGYAAYEEGFMRIFRQHGGKLLAVEEGAAVKEGDWPHNRTVLLEFPDVEAFEAWFESPDYQALAKHRHAASVASIAVIRGLTPPGG